MERQNGKIAMNTVSTVGPTRSDVKKMEGGLYVYESEEYAIRIRMTME
nr:hypothetical protein Iba_chr03bCG16470 [Ipomoea batatas]